jgi:glycosyltransferase involved in cell wall biosynthesis
MTQQPLKILICSSVFYPAIGGIENLSLFLVKEFVKKGHQVKVITEQVQDPAKPLEGVEIIHNSNRLAQIKLFFWSDLVFMPNITLKTVWLFLFNPIKKWVISHNDFSLMHTQKLKAKLKRFFISRADTNIAVSQALANYLHVHCEVVYNCYNSDVFKLYPEEPRDKDFLFVGRLVSQKGCELLIDACSKLNKEFTLSIVGDGFEYETLNQKVKDLKLEDKIKFHGFKQNEELARFINQHKVMVVPSLDVEGFGIVALEGLACGCTMVVSNAGGLAEAVQGQGYTFEMGNEIELKEILDKCLINSNLRKYDASTHNYLENHSKSSVADNYIKLFYKTLNK